LLIDAPIDTAIQAVDTNLSVIVAGRVPPNPSELLSSRRMTAMLDELRLHFDYIILDTAPLLPVADGLALARHVDGIVVVARSRRTTTGPLQHAINALKQVSAPVLGVVLNRVRPRSAAAGGYTARSEYGDKPTPPPKQGRPSNNDSSLAPPAASPSPPPLAVSSSPARLLSAPRPMANGSAAAVTTGQ
jgi:polysaccharide biosynthesis transport protein